MREIHSENNVYAVEFAPQYRTIKIDRRGWRKQKTDTFYLGFPYMQFYWYAAQLHLTFSKKPVQNLEKDEVAFPFLPNVWVDPFRVCLRIRSNQITEDLKKNMKTAIELFWEQHFYLSDDWYGPWLLPDLFEINPKIAKSLWLIRHRKVIKTFRTWEKRSKKDPEYIMNLNWPHIIKNPLRYVVGKKLLPLRGMEFAGSLHR